MNEPRQRPSVAICSSLAIMAFLFLKWRPDSSKDQLDVGVIVERKTNKHWHRWGKERLKRGESPGDSACHWHPERAGLVLSSPPMLPLAWLLVIYPGWILFCNSGDTEKRGFPQRRNQHRGQLENLEMRGTGVWGQRQQMSESEVEVGEIPWQERLRPRPLECSVTDGVRFGTRTFLTFLPQRPACLPKGRHLFTLWPTKSSCDWSIRKCGVNKEVDKTYRKTNVPFVMVARVRLIIIH